MVIMNLVTLKKIIQQSGGGSFALDYADDLLIKINNVANNQVSEALAKLMCFNSVCWD